MPDLLGEMYDHRLLAAVFEAEKRRSAMKDPPKDHDYGDATMAWYGELMTDMRRADVEEKRREGRRRGVRRPSVPAGR